MKVNKRKRAHMSKRTSAIVALCVALVASLCLGYLGHNGAWLDGRGLYKLRSWLPTTSVESWPASIPLGKDLAGGLLAEYALVEDETNSDEDQDKAALLEEIAEILRARLAIWGYSEATVSTLGNTGVRIELPEMEGASALLDMISAQAKVEFLDPEGNVFMDNSHLKGAFIIGDASGNPAISFTLTSEGASLFYEMTAKSIGQQISITLDGETLMSPSVSEAIQGDSVQISGQFTLTMVQNVVVLIRSGVLPLQISQSKLEPVSASLGEGALAACITAGIIGVALIMVLLVLRYRLGGLIASWGLAVSIILMFMLVAGVGGIQFTLSSFAGIVLGIVIAVSAHVAILEHVRREANEGRPMVHAVRLGVKSATGMAVDAGIAVAIAAIVLLFQGASFLQDFAAALLLSIIAALFTVMIVTRNLLANIVRVAHSPALYVSGANHSKDADTANGEAK